MTIFRNLVKRETAKVVKTSRSLFSGPGLDRVLKGFSSRCDAVEPTHSLFLAAAKTALPIGFAKK